MKYSNTRYTQLFFKLILLAVYVAFFSVQLFLRYSSSHSRQSLDLDNYQKVTIENPLAAKQIVFREGNKKSQSLSYLNKRFHPEDCVILPHGQAALQPVYAALPANAGLISPCIAEIKINAPLLRGPPSLC